MKTKLLATPSCTTTSKLPVWLGGRRTSAILAIAILDIVCAALGLVLFFRLFAEAGPSRASVITYVNPLVAVLVGMLALGEHLGPISVAGLLLILGGPWQSTGVAILHKRKFAITCLPVLPELLPVDHNFCTGKDRFPNKKSRELNMCTQDS